MFAPTAISGLAGLLDVAKTALIRAAVEPPIAPTRLPPDEALPTGGSGTLPAR